MRSCSPKVFAKLMPKRRTGRRDLNQSAKQSSAKQKLGIKLLLNEKLDLTGAASSSQVEAVAHDVFVALLEIYF